MSPKPWPEANDFKTEIESGARVWMDGDQHAYDRARADAALERLRLAVEALKESAEVIGCSCACAQCGNALLKVEGALQAIGEIPE
jgi:hypothetical protein